VRVALDNHLPCLAISAPGGGAAAALTQPPTAGSGVTAQRRSSSSPPPPPSLTGSFNLKGLDSLGTVGGRAQRPQMQAGARAVSPARAGGPSRSGSPTRGAVAVHAVARMSRDAAAASAKKPQSSFGDED
jgi:hypothetical protein